MALVNGRCGELEGGSNVLPGELGVFGHDVVRGEALGEQADDGGNRNSRAGNARHATHNPVISHHSIGRHQESVTPQRPPSGFPAAVVDKRWLL